jgi:hypothetical protein
MSNSAIALQVNLNTLIKEGWTIYMETGLRGKELRSWVTLQHFEKGLKHKIRSAQGDLIFALQSAMMMADVEFWDPTADRARCICPPRTSVANCPVCGEKKEQP